MEDLGNECLVFNPQLFGLLFEKHHVLAVDPHIQNRVLLPLIDSLLNLEELLRLTGRS